MSIKKLLLFPGQGSQSVGMGKPLFERYPSIQERFLEADEILGFKLSEVVAEGPEDKLKQTEYAQPAIIRIRQRCSMLLSSRGLSMQTRSWSRGIRLASSVPCMLLADILSKMVFA